MRYILENWRYFLILTAAVILYVKTVCWAISLLKAEIRYLEGHMLEQKKEPKQAYGIPMWVFWLVLLGIGVMGAVWG